MARSLAGQLGKRDRVLLEGAMGAGKSTFARALLGPLGVEQPPEGSPTFPIAHEYSSRTGGAVVHIDFYRLKSEEEIDEAGVPSYFWERDTLVICEWLSSWPVFASSVLDPEAMPRGATNWRVTLSFAKDQPDRRAVRVEKL